MKSKKRLFQVQLEGEGGTASIVTGKQIGRAHV